MPLHEYRPLSLTGLWHACCFFIQEEGTGDENVQAVQRILRRLKGKRGALYSKRKQKSLDDVISHVDEVGYEASSLQFQTNAMKGKSKP